jgi:hypothetical protein
MKANFCSNCGASLTENMSHQPSMMRNNSGNMSNMNNSLLANLVTVQLVNGLTKNVYENNGNYYSDKACRHKVNPALIMGVMGRDTDSMIDAMTLMGEEIHMDTVIKNQMAKEHMRFFNRRNKL